MKVLWKEFVIIYGLVSEIFKGNPRDNYGAKWEGTNRGLKKIHPTIRYISKEFDTIVMKNEVLKYVKCQL
jgi:hypothetical protein